MNKTILIGRLTRNAETKQFKEHTICKFSIAVNRPFAKDGEQSVDYINVIAWDKLGETCAKYLAKGKQVCVVGCIQTGSYEKNGVKIPTFDIRADSVEFLSPAADGNKDVDKLTPIDEDDDGDMPF